MRKWKTFTSRNLSLHSKLKLLFESNIKVEELFKVSKTVGNIISQIDLGVILVVSLLHQRFHFFFSNNQLNKIPANRFNMKVFQTIEKYFLVLGINKNESLNNRNFKMSLSILTLFMISNLIYLWHVANTFKEYTESTNVTSTTMVISLVLSVVVFRAMEMLAFIKNLEDVIDKSK